MGKKYENQKAKVGAPEGNNNKNQTGKISPIDSGHMTSTKIATEFGVDEKREKRKKIGLKKGQYLFLIRLYTAIKKTTLPFLSGYIPCHISTF